MVLFIPLPFDFGDLEYEREEGEEGEEGEEELYLEAGLLGPDPPLEEGDWAIEIAFRWTDRMLFI